MYLFCMIFAKWRVSISIFRYIFRAVTGHILLIFPSLSLRVSIYFGSNLFLCPFLAMNVGCGLITTDWTFVNLQNSCVLTHVCSTLIIHPVTNSSMKDVFLSMLDSSVMSKVSKCDSTFFRFHIGLVGGGSSWGLFRVEKSKNRI